MTDEPRFVLPFAYRPEILEALAALGIRPGRHTPPPLVRAYLNDLYRYELRRLRDRLLAGDFPKREYAGRVVSLRARYVLLSVPMDRWGDAAREASREPSRETGHGPGA
jgi:hypothetical protein